MALHGDHSSGGAFDNIALKFQHEPAVPPLTEEKLREVIREELASVLARWILYRDHGIDPFHRRLIIP